MQVNGSNQEPSKIIRSNEMIFICVGCGHREKSILIAGGGNASHSRECPRCHYMTMLPQDTPEVDVLKMRVAFLESVSSNTIKTLKEVIDSQDKEAKELSTRITEIGNVLKSHDLNHLWDEIG